MLKYVKHAKSVFILFILLYYTYKKVQILWCFGMYHCNVVVFLFCKVL